MASRREAPSGSASLAVEVARRQRARRRDGVWIVDLLSSPDAPDVAGETAKALDVRGATGVALTDALRRFLSERDALLVLDNCEHVIAACARLATDLLTSALQPLTQAPVPTSDRARSASTLRAAEPPPGSAQRQRT